MHPGIRQRKSSSNNNNGFKNENSGAEDQRQQQQKLSLEDGSLPSATSSTSLSIQSSSSFTSVGCAKQYADKRTMTPFQEKINAITILPSAVWCLYYLLAGQWLLPESIQTAQDKLLALAEEERIELYQQLSCLHFSSTVFPNLHSIPPPTILAIAMGILLHAPCSFLYHWRYASLYCNEPLLRLQHWSRRMDHSAIHTCSIFWSYGVSGGNIPFALANLLYNVDCIRYHWHEEIIPRRNQLRILGSMLLYTSPLLWMSHDNDDNSFLLFFQVWALFLVAVWLFAAYPLRGWSHAAFHIVMMAVPPLLCDRVAHQEATGKWSLAAAQCVALIQHHQEAYSK